MISIDELQQLFNTKITPVNTDDDIKITIEKVPKTADCDVFEVEQIIKDIAYEYGYRIRNLLDKDFQDCPEGFQAQIRPVSVQINSYPIAIVNKVEVNFNSLTAGIPEDVSSYIKFRLNQLRYAKTHNEEPIKY